MNHYYNNHTLVFLDGKFIKATDAQTGLFSQTLHYGSVVFEGIRSYNTLRDAQIFKAEEHFQRLLFSAQAIHIQIGYTVNELIDASYAVLKENSLTDAYIRPLIYLGENMSLTPTDEVHVFIAAWEWGKYLGDKLLHIGLSSYQRPNPKSCDVRAKVCGHYTNSILATIEARSKGYDEALLTDMHGNIAEGPGANFFYQKEGVLYTPPAGNILPGITRATIIGLAEELGYAVEEKLFTPDDLYSGESAFFCGTAVEIAGIGKFGNHTFPLEWKNSMGAV